jgi:hypothetical protein
LGHLLQPPLNRVPELSAWIDELHQLEAEFGEVRVDWSEKYLSVSTGPITLQGVYLGPFAIHFFWERLSQGLAVYCFDVVALDPQPAAANESVTHPHVKDEALCAGDAADPLERAVADGRLSDAFCLIQGVLATYNPGSPYVALEHWLGEECEECRRPVDEDERYCCEACDSHLCSDCTSDCSLCDSVLCGGCISRCDVCEQGCCRSCLKECAHSSRACCSECLQTCAGCKREIARDEYEDEAALCPDCQRARDGEPSDDLCDAEEQASLRDNGQETLLENDHADPISASPPMA